MEITVSIENGLKNIYIYVIMLVHNELFGCACAGHSILYTPPTYYYSLTPITYYNPPYFYKQLLSLQCSGAHAEVQIIILIVNNN